jgi:hypothetical protein
MTKRRAELARYYGIVAAIFLAFLMVLVLLGDGALANIPARMWFLPIAGAAMGCFFTFVCMLRFGSMGGSVYFTPTALHIAVILAMAWLFTLQLYRK